VRLPRPVTSVPATGLFRDERLFRLILENVDDLITVIDPQGRRLYNSPSYRRILGDNGTAPDGDAFQEIHPEDRDRIRKAFRETIRTGISPRMEYRFVTADGRIRQIESQGNVIRDAAGEVAHVVVISRDVTARTEAIKKLNLIAYALACTRDCFCLTDLDNVILFVNPAFCLTYGYAEHELVGKHIDLIRSPLNSSELCGGILRGTLEGSWNGELMNRRKDGTEFPVELWTSVVRDDSGNPVGLAGIARDISERKRAQEREGSFRLMFRSSPIPMWVYDTETLEFLEVNESAVEKYGYTREEFLHMRITDIRPAEDDTRLLETLRKPPEERHSTGEWRHLLKNGRAIDVEISSHALKFAGRNARHVTAQDITERKRAEQLQSAVYRIAQAADSSPTLEKLFKAVHRIIHEVMPANNLYIALYDERSDLISFPYFVDEVDHPSPPKHPEKGLTEYVLRTGKPLLCDPATQEELEKRGEAILIGVPSPIWLGVPLIVEKKTIGVMTVQHYSDPSAYGEREQHVLEFVSSQVAKAIESKQAEEALRVSEERYRQFVEQSSEGIWRFELDEPISISMPEEEQIHHFYSHAYVAECNDAMAHMCGVSSANELMGSRLGELLRPENPVSDQLLRDFILSGYRLTDAESSETDSSGASRHFLNNLVGMIDDGHLKRIWGTRRDLTQHKRAEEMLRLSEEKYRTLFEESKDGIFLSTPDGKLIDVNPAGIELMGYDSREELLGIDLVRDLYVNAEDREIFKRTLARQGYVIDFEFEIKLKTGEKRMVLESASAVRDTEGTIIAYRSFLRDITERKRLEEQFRQAQKMEGIGTLAGGIAHDFNNILGIILGYTEMMQKGTPDLEKLRMGLATIEVAVERGAALVRQLLTFARKADPSFESVNVNDTVQELSRMLTQTFPKTISISLQLDERMPSVLADASQLHQALLNLSLNSRDAMMDGAGAPGGGILALRTKVVSGRDLRRKFSGAAADEYVCVEVEDNGMGMDEATRNRIFEPFFTTKELGKGTGLGLAVVYGVVKSHHGLIDVRSSCGAGTTLSLYLPVQSRTIVPASPASPDRSEPRGGSETVLLVEDEEMLRELLTSLFEEHGYRVLAAKDGAEGVEIYRSNKDCIALVLSDMGLPKLGGWEMFQQMMALNPRVKAILASGYFDPNLKMTMMKAGAKDFIQKPYVSDLVLERVRDVIDAG
jgi:PAS domain S-box-containing protein